MLDLLLVTMSLISVVSIFFLCYVSYTLNEELKHNEDVIDELKHEILLYNDELKQLTQSREDLWQRYKRLLKYVKNNMQV